MSGRFYRLRYKKNKNRINLFTYQDYGEVCKMIKLVNRPGAEPKHVYVWVYSKDQLSKVGTFIDEILRYNNISYKKWGIFDSVGKKLKFVFDDKDMAARAQNLISNMGLPDSIDPDKINLNDGSVVSNYGVKVKVNLTQNQDGSRSPQGGGNVQGSKSSSSSSKSGVSWTRWLLIGGVIIAVVIVAALIYKRKK